MKIYPGGLFIGALLLIAFIMLLYILGVGI